MDDDAAPLKPDTAGIASRGDIPAAMETPMSTTTRLVIAATLLAFGVLHLIGSSISEAKLDKAVGPSAAMTGD